MTTFLIVLLGFVFAVLCLLMIVLVLFQPGKSGSGLGGLGGGAASSAISETLGATHGEKTLVRWTSFLAAGFFVIALLLTVLTNVKQSAPSRVLDLPGGAAETDTRVISVPTGEAAEELGMTLEESSTGGVVQPGETQVLNVEVPTPETTE